MATEAGAESGADFTLHVRRKPIEHIISPEENSRVAQPPEGRTSGSTQGRAGVEDADLPGDVNRLHGTHLQNVDILKGYTSRARLTKSVWDSAPMKHVDQD
jgi:hypothetical protein